MAKILIDLKDCRQCPYCGSKLTKGYGYATDYFCKKNNDKVTSSYVEWEIDMNPIPDWCPILYTEGDSWSKWPDRMGGQFTDEEIDMLRWA